jgi:hypothetical protein
MKELERLARAVCRADGYDPDVSVNKYQQQIGAFGWPVVHGELTPQWALYVPVVQYTLTALIDGAEQVGGDFKAFTISVLNGAEAPGQTLDDPPPMPPRERSWRARYGLLPVPK